MWNWLRRLLYPNVKVATVTWFAVAGFVNLLSVYEILAVNYHWWHTISWLSFVHPFLGWVIAAGFFSLFLWWLWHSHHSHPWFVVSRRRSLRK